MTDVRTHTAREGFTLVEILIAITIIAIAGAIVGPNLYKYLATGRETATKGNLRSLSSAIDQFYLEMGDHPSRLRDLVRKPQEEKFAKKWTQSYLYKTNNIPADGWDNPFQYKKPGEKGHPYELYSYGPNGKGAPKDEWISVWDL